MDKEKELLQWDLYKSYGEFNLYFEAVVAEIKKLLIVLVRRYYGYDVDWEDIDTEERVDEEFQDRLIKIILHDDGAMSIIEKCRACFKDIFNPKVQRVLEMNDISLLKLTISDLNFADSLFKKGQELVVLRNIIIHSHYNGVIYNFFPKTTLRGRKEVKTSKGYELREYQYNIEYFDIINEHISELATYVNFLRLNLTIGERDCFKKNDFSKIEQMNFTPPKL